MLSIVRELKALAADAKGRTFASLVVVKRLAAKTASNGNTFFSVEFGDRTGSFSCTIFGDSPVFEIIKTAGEGAIVRLEGKIDFYQDRLSPRISIAVALNEAELGAPGLLDNLIETAPENADALWQELNGFIDRIAHLELRVTVRGVFDEIGETFRWSPAALAMHHA
jgi:3'-5' exoribonuclease